MDASDLRYLRLLSQSFPTIADASAEVINLSAVLSLPKGTELFASAIHGEHAAFAHLLRNGSGSPFSPKATQGSSRYASMANDASGRMLMP